MSRPHPGQQWKHGWIPLTPAAAIQKNHGRKPGSSSHLVRTVPEAAEVRQKGRTPSRAENKSDAGAAAPSSSNSSAQEHDPFHKRYSNARTAHEKAQTEYEEARREYNQANDKAQKTRAAGDMGKAKDATKRHDEAGKKLLAAKTALDAARKSYETSKNDPHHAKNVKLLTAMSAAVKNKPGWDLAGSRGQAPDAFRYHGSNVGANHVGYVRVKDGKYHYRVVDWKGNEITSGSTEDLNEAFQSAQQGQRVAKDTRQPARTSSQVDAVIRDMATRRRNTRNGSRAGRVTTAA